MEPFEIKVIFFQVRATPEKLAHLTKTAQHHFERKEPFLIFVEDDKALEFVDKLLWSTPETSFLPHVVSDGTTSEPIVITKEKKVLNGARAVFNLCSTPLLIEGPFRVIYDFEDLISPGKKSLSQLRFDSYKKAKYLIEAR